MLSLAFPLGIKSHPGFSQKEGQRDPGEAEGTLRESAAFFHIYFIQIFWNI